MKKLKVQTIRPVIPMCYAYTTPQIKSHDGWTKIGFTEQNVEDRIRQQTQTADVQFVLEWKANALYDDGSGDIFHDTDFHGYLKKLDIERKSGTEWFKVAPKESKRHFDDFRTNRGVLDTAPAIGYLLRQEQDSAVKTTQLYFETNKEYAPEFLWNAKPRFGKTLAAYDLCKRLGAKKVLIVTNRPAIANSWYRDYVTFLGTESGYYFISEAEALKNEKYVYSRKDLPSSARGYIEFLSLQDMKGSIYFGGSYKKLEEEKGTQWDVLIIDEAHEGVDTYKTDTAFDQIERKYTLHLSGTPFKAIAREKFEEKAIFSWTYADEQKAKREWSPKDTQDLQENPYANLPQLNLYTYQMSDIVQDIVKQGIIFDDHNEPEDYAFNLNEFFATTATGSFKHEEAVDAFLNALTTQEKFPFSTEELRKELNHTFWLLDRVDSAKALAKKLKNHPVFKDYEIILAAGNGKLDDMEETKKSYNKVIEAIQKYPRTITLSVGQLTTGVTIPEWTAVLMLSNVKSPSLYIQSAFRAQNPCLFNRNGQFYRKENAYVFDFDPARTLDTVERFANDLDLATTGGKGDTDARKQNVRELLNFFPVYAEDDDGEMIALDAEKVLSIPRKIHAKEVVKRGFMSNFLFQNISNVFNGPKELTEIIQKLEKSKEPKPIQLQEDLQLDENGEVNVSDEIVIGKSKDLFGKEVYGEVTDNLEKVVEDLQQTNNKNDQDKMLEKLQEEWQTNLTNPLVEKAKEDYGKDMTKSTTQTVIRKIKMDTDMVVKKEIANLKIQQNILESNRYKEIEAAKKQGDTKSIASINQKYDLAKVETMETFKKNLKEKAHAVVELAGKTIVKEVETTKRETIKQGLENTVRDHLRGFSRTIPSFLMAYGDENTTLENFDTIIPENIFQEVTGISLEWFKRLRDGYDYLDAETCETKRFNGHLFDPVVFNDSIKEFLSLKTKLANYFDESTKEDIFDYIPPQKTNQIYTPKKVVKEMVDMLEQEEPDCFSDSDKTFIDLYMKSGLYIAEIVKRLYNNPAMKQKYPNNTERLNHIFAKQVYGLAPTEIIYRIATSFILGFDDSILIDKHHLRQFDTLPAVQKGNLEQALDDLYKV